MGYIFTSRLWTAGFDRGQPPAELSDFGLTDILQSGNARVAYFTTHYNFVDDRFGASRIDKSSKLIERQEYSKTLQSSSFIKEAEGTTICLKVEMPE